MLYVKQASKVNERGADTDGRVAKYLSRTVAVWLRGGHGWG